MAMILNENIIAKYINEAISEYFSDDYDDYEDYDFDYDEYEYKFELWMKDFLSDYVGDESVSRAILSNEKYEDEWQFNEEPFHIVIKYQGSSDGDGDHWTPSGYSFFGYELKEDGGLGEFISTIENPSLRAALEKGYEKFLESVEEGQYSN